jgi:hypothetical protein
VTTFECRSHLWRPVATMKRFPQRTTESTLPTPGTICPGVTFQTPLGPSITAVPLTTSRSVQPSIVVGRVSGVGVRRGVGSLLARDSGAVLMDVVETEETFGFCDASAGVFRAISRTIVSCN